jgi:hypothetical protein
MNKDRFYNGGDPKHVDQNIYERDPSDLSEPSGYHSDSTISYGSDPEEEEEENVQEVDLEALRTWNIIVESRRGA